jgi:hypothetical protein
LWQFVFTPSWSSVSTFWIFASVIGGASSCAMMLSTAGVYGAAASTGGDVAADGNCAGRS